MAAQPAPLELAVMTKVKDAMDWAPIQGDFLAAACTELGVDLGDPVRTLANVGEKDIDEAKKSMEVRARAERRRARQVG